MVVLAIMVQAIVVLDMQAMEVTAIPTEVMDTVDTSLVK